MHLDETPATNVSDETQRATAFGRESRPGTGPLTGPLTGPFTSRFPTSPRLVVTDPLIESATPRATVANLTLPTARVQERATALVELARATGHGHSLRLWRQALQSALVELAREASGLPATVSCQAFSWETSGESYHVMATFTPRATVH